MTGLRFFLAVVLLCGTVVAADSPVKAGKVLLIGNQVSINLHNDSDKVVDRVDFKILYHYKLDDPHPVYQSQHTGKDIAPGKKIKVYYFRAYPQGWPDVSVLVEKVTFKDGTMWELEK